MFKAATALARRYLLDQKQLCIHACKLCSQQGPLPRNAALSTAMPRDRASRGHASTEKNETERKEDPKTAVEKEKNESGNCRLKMRARRKLVELAAPEPCTTGSTARTAASHDVSSLGTVQIALVARAGPRLRNANQRGLDGRGAEFGRENAREAVPVLADLDDVGLGGPRPTRSGVAGVLNPRTPPGKDGSGWCAHSPRPCTGARLKATGEGRNFCFRACTGMKPKGAPGVRFTKLLTDSGSSSSSFFKPRGSAQLARLWKGHGAALGT